MRERVAAKLGAAGVTVQVTKPVPTVKGILRVSTCTSTLSSYVNGEAIHILIHKRVSYKYPNEGVSIIN